MSKRTVTPLFALAVGLSTPAMANPTAVKPRTLPSGAPACGNAQTKGPRRPCTATTESPSRAQPVTAGVVPVTVRPVTVRPVTVPPTIDPAAAAHGFRVIAKAMVLLGLRAPSEEQLPEAEPRCMKNGSPACGNVARRTPSRSE